jgi:hypothetical protein
MTPRIESMSTCESWPLDEEKRREYQAPLIEAAREHFRLGIETFRWAAEQERLRELEARRRWRWRLRRRRA